MDHKLVNTILICTIVCDSILILQQKTTMIAHASSLIQPHYRGLHKESLIENANGDLYGIYLVQVITENLSHQAFKVKLLGMQLLRA